MSHKIDGLALISSTLDNLIWWKNNKIPQQTPNDSYKLLLKITDNLKAGLNNLYRFKRLALAIAIDKSFSEMIEKDKELHGVGITIIHNQPKNEEANEAYINRSLTYNISINAN